MKKRLSPQVRQAVSDRAKGSCEYCQIHQDDLFLAFEIDHIISVKHGGGDEFENLAWACPHCNHHKGSDISTFLVNYDDLSPLFNPRKQKWEDHFQVVEGEITAKTREGSATIKLLRLNEPERLIHRRLLMEVGRYPLKY